MHRGSVLQTNALLRREGDWFARFYKRRDNAFLRRVGSYVCRMDEEVLADRREWSYGFGECFVCGEPAVDIHEMERKSQAPRGWADRCNYLAVCRVCHDGPLAAMPHARQLAYKLVGDPEHFDLDRWLGLRVGSGSRDRVTWSEVLEEVEHVIDQRRFGVIKQLTIWRRIDARIRDVQQPDER